LSPTACYTANEGSILAMLETTPNSRFLIILILLYSALLIYASLMPFTWVESINFQQTFHHDFWSDWPFNSHRRISGSDFVSNLALYMPLGFLLATQITLSNRTSRKTTIILVLIFCGGLSLGIECLQTFIVNRVPSASDWLLNSISGLVGAIAGIIFGHKYFYRVTAWLTDRWQHWPLDIFTLLLLMLLCADALSPFLPTIKLSQVWRSLKRSHFDLVDGFSQHPWHWWIMVKIQTFHLISLMLSFWNGAKQHQRHWVKFACITVLLALGMELMKPMIASRTINVANVIASNLGSFLVVITGPLLITRISRKSILTLAILSILSYLLYLGWTPFNFNWELQSAKQKLPNNLKELLPLYHYAMGATMEHARLFVQNITLSAILVYLLRLRYDSFNSHENGIYFALLTGLIVGILQEGGQFFLVNRTPSMTDIYCFLIGGYLGTKIPRNDKLRYDSSKNE